MEHTACAVPWLGALLVLQTQQLQAVLVGLFPVLAGVLVVTDILNQCAGQRLHGALVHEVRQVGLEVVGRGLAFFEADLQTVNADVDLFWVNDLNLDRGLVLSGFVDAHGGGIQTFFDTHGGTFQ